MIISGNNYSIYTYIARCIIAAALSAAALSAAKAQTCSGQGFTQLNLGTYKSYLPSLVSLPQSYSLTCSNLTAARPVKYCLNVAAFPKEQPYMPGYHFLFYNITGKPPYIPLNFYRSDNKIWGNPNDYGESIIGDTGADSGAKTYTIPYVLKLGLPGGYLIGAPDPSSASYSLYQNYFTINFNYSADPAISDTDLCAGAAGSFGGNSLLLLRAYTQNSCNVRVNQNINFPLSMDLSKVPVTRGEFRVSCDDYIAYGVNLDAGRNNGGDFSGPRLMRCQKSAVCGYNAVKYDLYQDAGCTKVWNLSNGQVYGQGTKTFSVYGKVYPGQDTVPQGAYTDAVVISVIVNAITPPDSPD